MMPPAALPTVTMPPGVTAHHDVRTERLVKTALGW
jgi:hypothetical protein